MILIYPLIVSKTVSPDILPGVCKALEKYILVYEQDSLFERVNKDLAIKAKNAAKREKFKSRGSAGVSILKNTAGMFRLENTSLDDPYIKFLLEAKKDKTADVDFSAGKGSKKGTMPELTKVNTAGGSFNKTGAQVGTVTGTKQGDAKIGTVNIAPPPPKSAPPPKQETVKIGKPPSESLTVEPTYIQIHVEDEGSKILGVKVVPFIIQNDTPLIQLMMNDKNRSSFAGTIHIQSRKLLRFMYRVANSLWKWTVGPALSWTGFVGDELYKGTITGDWKKDIVLGLTDFHQNLFVMLNNIDIKKDFFLSAGSVKRLFSFGWSSFIINDDVNGRTMFCMKEFKGMCSISNHSYLYSSVSRESGQAFKDIQDIKRSSGPLFRTRGRINNMLLRDDLATEKLNKYLPLNENIEVLEEGFMDDSINKIKSFFNSKPKSITFVKNLKRAVETKDVKKITDLTNSTGISFLSLDKIKQMATSKIENFNTMHKFSVQVLNNSLPGSNEKVVDAVASLVAVQCSDKRKCVDLLKKIVAKTRDSIPKSVKQGDSDWDKELIIALIFSSILIAGVGTVGFGLIYYLPTILGSVFSGIHSILVMIFIISLVMVLITILKAVFSSKDSGGPANTSINFGN